MNYLEVFKFQTFLLIAPDHYLNTLCENNSGQEINILARNILRIKNATVEKEKPVDNVQSSPFFKSKPSGGFVNSWR